MIPEIDGLLCWHLHGKNSVNAAIDAGMPLSSHALKSVNKLKRMQPRMMYASFNGNLNTTIFSCYSLTNASDEIVTITFNDALP